MVTIGEPLPIDAGEPRIMRAGLLGRELRSRGHDVVWFSARFDHTAKRHRRGASRQLLDDGTELVLLRSCGYRSNVSVRRWVDHVMLAGDLLAASRRAGRPDVVVASLPPPELALAATFVARGGYRVVDVRDKWPDVLSDPPPTGTERVGAAVMGAATRLSLRRADAIWSHAGAFLEWGLMHAGRPRQIYDEVFPHGYEMAGPRAVRHREDATLRLAFAGALSGWFDFALVADALAKVNADGRRVTLTVCGAGPAEPALRQLAAGRDDIELAGFVDRRALWNLFAESDAGLAPYVDSSVFTDSLPNKLIEYCAAGLPVVTSIRGEGRDLVVGSGAGFAYDTADQLAEILNHLTADRGLLDTVRSAAGLLFDANFEASAVCRRAAAHLEALVDGR